MAFNIYTLEPGGKAVWQGTSYDTDTPSAALEQKHRTHPHLVPEGSTFFVVDPARNPRGGQAVFTLGRSESPVRALPISLVI